MPYGGTTPEQDKKIERCVADLVAKGNDKSKAIAICKASVMKHEDVEPVVYENVELNWKSPITLVESIKTDENSRKIGGMALPAAESRNGRTYRLEDIKTARFGGKSYEPGTELIIGLDHSETVTDNVGKWIPTFEENGIGFKGMAFNTGKHPYITDMLDKKLLPFVSIEARADLVKEKDTLFAKNLDILGMDFVKHPGMVDAHVGLAEAFDTAIEKELTYKARKELPDSAFVYPEERKYPIHDIAHARNALARVAQNGTPEEQKKVRAAVYRKYPELRKDDKQSIGDEMTKEIMKEKEEEEQVSEEKNEEKTEEKADSSLIEKIFKKLDESTESQKAIEERIKKLEEKPKSKGVVTETQETGPRLIIEKKSGGYVDIYSEDDLY